MVYRSWDFQEGGARIWKTMFLSLYPDRQKFGNGTLGLGDMAWERGAVSLERTGLARFLQIL